MGSISHDPSGVLSEFTPRSYPPFPSETKPCVEFQTISLAALQAEDPSEQARLLSICKGSGFFFLDTSDTSAKCLTEDAETVMRVSEDFFRLPYEEKMKFPVGRKPNSLIGYKPAGVAKADAYGTKRDTAEFMNIGKDDIMDVPGRIPTEVPSVFTTSSNRTLLTRLQTIAHKTGLEILSSLATGLGLPPDTFEDMHRLNRPADSHVRAARGPPRLPGDEIQIQSPGHTDFGTITLLFNWLGGLQLWSEPNHGETFDNAVGSELGPQSGRQGEWLWVKPKANRIIVNLGDNAVKSTGGVLCAGRHRVLPAPGAQGQFPRYSLVYFVRPADDHVIRRLKGGAIPEFKEGEVEEELTAAQWTERQFQNLKNGAKKP